MKQFFYQNKKGERKSNGIYSPGLDRWLLVDPYDHWVTLQTAQILSSKIALMVYILPNNGAPMTNDNCLNYGIFDKTGEKKAKDPDIITGQIPKLRKLEFGQILEHGPHVDYQTPERMAMLKNLKEYAEFTQEYMYATLYCNSIINIHDYTSFTDTFLPGEWIDPLMVYEDRTNIESGFLVEIKKILYTSMTLDEAKSRMDSIWDTDSVDVKRFKSYFDRMIGKGI